VIFYIHGFLSSLASFDKVSVLASQSLCASVTKVILNKETLLYA
jgi:hypothetical protein